MKSLIKDVHSGPMGARKVIRVTSFWYLNAFFALNLLFILFSVIYAIFTGEWFIMSVRATAVGLLASLISIAALIGLYATDD